MDEPFCSHIGSSSNFFLLFVDNFSFLFVLFYISRRYNVSYWSHIVEWLGPNVIHISLRFFPLFFFCAWGSTQICEKHWYKYFSKEEKKSLLFMSTTLLIMQITSIKNSTMHHSKNQIIRTLTERKTNILTNF